VLRELACILKEALRDTDFIFRIGDDFLVLLPGTPLKGALRAGENLRRRVEVHSFILGEDTGRLTVSVGVTEIRKPLKESREILDKLSRAIYLAKKTGKNRIAVEE